jgi:hypothetical protein
MWVFIRIKWGKMTIDIKGIQFNIHELEEVSIDSLETGTLSTAHVFYLTSSKKPFLLLRAGEIITGAFISKYKNKRSRECFDSQGD